MTWVSSPPADADAPAGATLDPRRLIDASRGPPLRVRAWPLFAVLLGAMLLSTLPDSDAGRLAGRVLSVALVVGGAVALTIAGRRIERRLDDERQAVNALEELIQLRRWPDAADLAARILGRPMLAPERRVGALLSLATILGRYHRFGEARVVHEALLADDAPPDASIVHAVRIARAMSLLRDDLLIDADRAMSEIRRDVSIARDAARRAGNDPAAVRSAGLVLLDLYRDVKTGHADEAIAIFESSIAWLPDSLGLRVADAWMLAAAAYDRVGRADEARTAYENATTLVPAEELHRRLPDTASLAPKFGPLAPVPGGEG